MPDNFNMEFNKKVMVFHNNKHQKLTTVKALYSNNNSNQLNSNIQIRTICTNKTPWEVEA